MSDNNGTFVPEYGHGKRPPDGDGTEAEEAIAQMFDDYLAGFNDSDATRISDCFALPATIWQHEKGHVFNDDDELSENIEALLAALDKEGVSHSDFHVSSSHISGSVALVTLDWQQDNSDGETVFEFTCHYSLVRHDEDWTIAMVVNE